jgi:hypothetical protein
VLALPLIGSGPFGAPVLIFWCGKCHDTNKFDEDETTFFKQSNGVTQFKKPIATFTSTSNHLPTLIGLLLDLSYSILY